MERHRHRNGHVDPYHTGLHAVEEILRRAPVAREDRGAVAELVGIDQRERILETAGANHREHRAEDLLAVDAHFGRDPVEQCRAQEEAALIVLEQEIAAVGHQLRPFGHALFDIAAHLVAMLGRYQRAHVVAVIRARADPQRLDAGDQPLDQAVRRFLAHRHGHADRHAALACRTVSRAHQIIDRLVHVRIGHDHHVVLCPAQRLHPLAGLRTAPVDILGHRRRSHEAHRRDPRIVEQRIHRKLVSLHHGEHPVGQAGLLQQQRQLDAQPRIALGRLEDKAVAAGQRHREHPHGDHGGEVERRDARHHAQRLADRKRVDVAPHAFGVFALEQLRDATGELHHFQPAHDLALRVGQHLAVLAGDQRGQPVDIALHQVAEAEQHPRADMRRGRRPARESRLGAGDGPIDQRRVGQSHAARLQPRRGIEHRRGAPARTVHPIARDKMRDQSLFSHCSLSIGLPLRHAKLDARSGSPLPR